MAYVPTAGAAGAAAAAAIANAIKASGVLVSVSPEDFQTILNRTREPLVVYAQSRWFGTSHRYLVSYKGLAFLTKSSTPLTLPGGVELVHAKQIWTPG